MTEAKVTAECKHERRTYRISSDRHGQEIWYCNDCKMTGIQANSIEKTNRRLNLTEGET